MVQPAILFVLINTFLVAFTEEYNHGGFTNWENVKMKKCPNDDWITGLFQCFFISTDLGTFQENKDLCQSLGAQMYVPRSKLEVPLELRQVLDDQKSYWLGIYAENGTQLTTDDSSEVYTNFVFSSHSSTTEWATVLHDGMMYRVHPMQNAIQLCSYDRIEIVRPTTEESKLFYREGVLTEKDFLQESNYFKSSDYESRKSSAMAKGVFLIICLLIKCGILYYRRRRKLQRRASDNLDTENLVQEDVVRNV